MTKAAIFARFLYFAEVWMGSSREVGSECEPLDEDASISAITCVDTKRNVPAENRRAMPARNKRALSLICRFS